ncbi:MAG: cytochrome P450 [Solirubrobacterales bacterium]
MRSALPPGPRYPSLIQAIGVWTRPLAYPERLRARYGKRFTTRFPGSPPFVVLSDPDEVKEVFMAPADVLHPGEGSRVLEPLVGKNSVILLDEGPHMEQRKLVLPAFHGEKMARLGGLMAEVAEREVESWPGGGSIPLQPRTQRLTLEIILRAVFGLDPGPRLDALRERLSELLAFGDRPISLMPPDPDGLLVRILERFGPFAEFVRLQQETDALLFELIHERREGSGERDDVLAMLLEARHEDGSPMSDQELRDELMTLLVAGHETTASSLAWAFERLARQPRVLSRLVGELDTDGDAYLVATIQETLRRRPVLPNVEPRLVKTPFEVGGWMYPVGACLVPNAYLIHHDPEIYPDPYEFRPERFLDEPPGTYTWIPFGGGRRRCIGASFAMLEMQIVIRTVLTHRELQPTQDGAEHASRRNIAVRPGRGAVTALGERRPAAVAAG